MSATRGAADGARHLARDVQRFGLLSAASVVDRYVDLVDRALGRSPAAATSTPSANRPAAAFMGTGTDPLVDSTTRVAEAFLGLLDAATLMLAADRSTEEGLVLGPVPPGDTTQSVLWAHNPAAEPTSDVTVTLGPLVAAEGGSMGADAATCTPERLEGIAAGGSARLDVRVDVPHDQRPGTYHGLVLVSLAPQAPISVRVQVLST